MISMWGLVQRIAPRPGASLGDEGGTGAWFLGKWDDAQTKPIPGAKRTHLPIPDTRPMKMDA